MHLFPMLSNNDFELVTRMKFLGSFAFSAEKPMYVICTDKLFINIYFTGARKVIG